MATGAGKTVVMAMILAWQILNKTAYPKDPRFSRDALVIAPGVTVRDRLAVLAPRSPDNYYEAFRIVPPALRDRLRRGRVLVRNRHALHWETDEKIAARRGVDKRGARSDEAWARAALDELADSRNLLVVNDEAHHAWRVPAGAQVRGVAKDEIERATRWVGALDRIARARGILACYDFSATPFAPSGRKSAEESLFGWIVSDFGLNDAIEAGLVKTPRVVVRDMPPHSINPSYALVNEGISLVHTKNVQAVQIVTPVMFVKQVITVYMHFLMFYSTPNSSICECASV